MHWILHQSNEQLNPNAKTRAGYEFNKSTEWKWKKKVCDKLSKNLRRFLLTFIVSNVCLCVSFFVWGNKINFIESDAIRPKTKSFRFKTISRIKLVLLLFFALLFSVCHVFFLLLFYLLLSFTWHSCGAQCSGRHTCSCHSAHLSQVISIGFVVEIAFAIDWATCHLNISKRSD